MAKINQGVLQSNGSLSSNPLEKIFTLLVSQFLKNYFDLMSLN